MVYQLGWAWFGWTRIKIVQFLVFRNHSVSFFDFQFGLSIFISFIHVWFIDDQFLEFVSMLVLFKPGLSKPFNFCTPLLAVLLFRLFNLLLATWYVANIIVVKKNLESNPTWFVRCTRKILSSNLTLFVARCPLLSKFLAPPLAIYKLINCCTLMLFCCT